MWFQQFRNITLIEFILFLFLRSDYPNMSWFWLFRQSRHFLAPQLVSSAVQFSSVYFPSIFWLMLGYRLCRLMFTVLKSEKVDVSSHKKSLIKLTKTLHRRKTRLSVLFRLTSESLIKSCKASCQMTKNERIIIESKTPIKLSNFLSWYPITPDFSVDNYFLRR